MALKLIFNPFTSKFDWVDVATAGPVTIPEYTSDPVGPTAGQTWVLKTLQNPANTLQALVGGVPMTTQADQNMYQLSYETNSDGIKRVQLT